MKIRKTLWVLGSLVCIALAGVGWLPYPDDRNDRGISIPHRFQSTASRRWAADGNVSDRQTETGRHIRKIPGQREFGGDRFQARRPHDRATSLASRGEVAMSMFPLRYLQQESRMEEFLFGLRKTVP